MLHVPSYNLGLSAGLAWKFAGKSYFNWYGKLVESSPEYKFTLEILNRSEAVEMFLPSSFAEGFMDAFSDSNYNFIETH